MFDGNTFSNIEMSRHNGMNFLKKNIKVILKESVNDKVSVYVTY